MKNASGANAEPIVAMEDVSLMKIVGNAAVIVFVLVMNNANTLVCAKPIVGMVSANLMRTARFVMIAVVTPIKIATRVRQELIQEVV